ncbi:hypothetical protein ID866_12316, partial [Astraeus odoratus]
MDNLATCIHSRYEEQGALGDLEEAISLHQQALELCPVGHPDRPTSLNNLAICIVSRYESQRTLATSSHLPPTIFPAAHQSINNDLQEILHTIPPRLLQTNTGTLLSQAEMIVQFYEKPEHQLLVSSLEQDGDWHSNLNDLKTSIANYFRYASLSHRWGSNEPLLQDILGHGSVYDMSPTDGLIKLKKFCHTAAHHGYSWAWSDTYCIDKTNSVELQEAIGSMFLWYQQSALTIVYLSDILPSSAAGVLSSSVWFRRGWTLQELLAPHTLLFYAQDWSLYMSSEAQNHKKDPHVLKELAHATGISS